MEAVNLISSPKYSEKQIVSFFSFCFLEHFSNPHVGCDPFASGTHRDTSP